MSGPQRTSPKSSVAGFPNIATDLLGDLEASPSPYHAVERASALLDEGGFQAVDHQSTLPSDAGRYYLVVGGAMVAWVQGQAGTTGSGKAVSSKTASDGTAPAFNIVGAHTDSPNLRVRAHADVVSGGWDQIGVETYGGLLLNSWLDRDLALAGRVSVLADGTAREVLVRDHSPILRIPQLAIHLDRDIRDKGLKLNAQTQMNPLWAIHTDDPAEGVASVGSDDGGSATPSAFLSYLSDLADVQPDQVLSWDLMAYDTHAPALVGRDLDMIASARIDNLFSVFCGVRALLAVSGAATGATPVLALYDHEEVGSTSSTGASGAFLGAILERISAAQGFERAEHLVALSNSFVVSADGAHATNPNYVDKHEPNHHIAMNAGIVIKRNANQRYATDATSEARFRAICGQHDIPLQTYIHRNDLPCGSTIGPITSGELAVSTVDIGAPQLAMHSIRELAGASDARFLTQVLQAVWTA